MRAHTLIIGGSGMLRAASVELASQTRRLTSVARTPESLAALDQMIKGRAGPHHMLALDWSQPEAFLTAIREHVEQTEPPELVLAWVHDAMLGIRLAAALGGSAGRFFHVLGSARTNPGKIAEEALGQLQASSGFHYHQIVLGARREGGRTRWLTNEEISSGTIEAIGRKEPRFVVGTLQRL